MQEISHQIQNNILYVISKNKNTRATSNDLALMSLLLLWTDINTQGNDYYYPFKRAMNSQWNKLETQIRI